MSTVMHQSPPIGGISNARRPDHHHHHYNISPPLSSDILYPDSNNRKDSFSTQPANSTEAAAAVAALPNPNAEPQKRLGFMARFLGLDRSTQKSPSHSRRPSNASTTAAAAAADDSDAPISPVHRTPSLAASVRSNDTAFAQKYGTCSRECIGRGATAVVRVAHKVGHAGSRMYAIKEFRRRRQNESEREYVKKLTSEFCVSSSLHHENVVETLDLIQDERKHWCQVMEFCPGGDLYTIIRDGMMGPPEINCCFKQMVRGVAYIHSLGVAHRDIKPENLLLDTRNTVKLTDFGVADVFRTAWEKRIHMSRGLCGSEPYIAPEMFTDPTYDARKVDVWSCAIVYYAMIYRSIPWRIAKESDSNYHRFIEARRAGRDYEGFKKMEPAACKLIQRMLDPDPVLRPTLSQVISDPWFASIVVCDDDGRTPDGTTTHNHYTEEYIDRRNYIQRRQGQHNRREAAIAPIFAR